jgi:hypothetical protein
MSLFREWANRARKEGLDGAIISQIIRDPNFEQNLHSIIAQFAEKRRAATFPAIQPAQAESAAGSEAGSQEDQSGQTESTPQVESVSTAGQPPTSIPADTDAGTTRITEASTSDMPDIAGTLSNVKRDLIKSYSLSSPSWRRLVATVPLRDMKPVTRLRRSDTDKYIAVPEGGEHEQGDFSSYKVTYSPKKYEPGSTSHGRC